MVHALVSANARGPLGVHFAVNVFISARCSDHYSLRRLIHLGVSRHDAASHPDVKQAVKTFWRHHQRRGGCRGLTLFRRSA
ncbi:MAG: hypothetical protein Udaeo2_27000 [Candidatus Udaeobacter sp.]|nr:MAG: hypothetical protein Udaeo2_27000 [Candidatus Udaeobacter sp.]